MDLAVRFPQPSPGGAGLLRILYPVTWITAIFDGVSSRSPALWAAACISRRVASGVTRCGSKVSFPSSGHTTMNRTPQLVVAAVVITLGAPG